MNVLLTKEMEHLVSSQLESGRYRSADEVIEAALSLLHERDERRASRLQELRGSLASGLADLDQGRAQVLDRESLQQLKRDARERLASEPG